jgi:hypothetical protein
MLEWSLLFLGRNFMRTKISHWLNGIAVGLFLLGPLMLCNLWIASHQSGIPPQEGHWGYGISMAILFPLCASLFAMASFATRMSYLPVFIVIVSIIFDFNTFAWYFRITDGFPNY